MMQTQRRMTAMSEPFDFEKFLKPISKSAPCGDDVRYESIYDEISEARREDDPNLPQGIWTTALKKADWNQVITLCEATLCKRSKDLQVAAWLAEAYLQRDGIPGLTRGLQLIGMISDTYWEQVYPLIVDGDLEFRLSAFEWLNQKLIERIYLIPLTNSEEEAKIVNLGEWVILSKNRNAKEHQARSELFQEVIKTTSLTFYENLKRDSETCLEKMRKVEKLLFEKKAGAEGPLHKLRHLIEDLVAFLNKTIEQKKPVVIPKETRQETPQTQAPEPQAPQEKNNEPAEMITADPHLLQKAHIPEPAPTHTEPHNIQNRDQAYAYLRLAAEYLAQTEPHNPSHYLVNKAISWANLSLGDVLKQLVKDPQFMEQALDLLGFTNPIAPPQQHAAPLHMTPPSQKASPFPKYNFGRDNGPKNYEDIPLIDDLQR